METVNIQKVFKKDYTKPDGTTKTFYDVTLADGRKGSCNDAKILDYVGKSVALELKPAKEYKGVMQYYFNFPKGSGASQAVTPPTEHRGQTQLDRIEALLVKINDTLNPPF